MKVGDPVRNLYREDIDKGFITKIYGDGYYCDAVFLNASFTWVPLKHFISEDDFIRTQFHKKVLEKHKIEEERQAQLHKKAMEESLIEETRQEQLRKEAVEDRKKAFLIRLHKNFEADFLNADRFFKSDVDAELIDINEYRRLKSEYVTEFIKKRCSVIMNNEQSLALCKTANNQLIRARAGSGKTTVVGCKAILLMECENIDPDQILILAFNKIAATIIGNKIRKDYGASKFNNERTFHGLAYQIVQPKNETLLFDAGGEFSSPQLSNYVRNIVRKIWSPYFQAQLQKFFRKEMVELKNVGALLNDQDYLVFRRNLRQVTLAGESVKSIGEKYIADFLFENSISYNYEKIYFWGTQNYRPDFTIHYQQNDYIIEHWGVDENDPNSQLPDWWSIDRKKYIETMEKKRAYWEEKSTPLIETSVIDLRDGRESFENILRSRLMDKGILCQKIPAEELEKKVVRNHVNRMTQLFLQFIQRAKKQMLTVQDIVDTLKNYSELDERTEVFYDLALRVYAEYEKELQITKCIDFDDLMVQAINKVNTSKGNCSISVSGRQIKMNDLKWIMIDEYQDFSKLFFELILAIKKYNAELRLLCVGDSWQAINTFAGSDVRYFTEFINYFPDSEESDLLTNFRSKERIVEFSNKLMLGHGNPCVALPGKQGGAVFIDFIDSTWIELRSGDEYQEEKEKDSRFIFYQTGKNGQPINIDNGCITAKYLKRCYEIITDPNNLGKKFAILSRTNRIHGIDLNGFLTKLRQCFTSEDHKVVSDFSNKIRIGTIHSFKGGEACNVIILNVCDGAIPKIHPDYVLFKVLGETETDILDEERRLFYVALTRAKENLWILTEEDHISCFVEHLDLEKDFDFSVFI